MKHPHPVTVITGLPKFSYLVLVPVFQKLAGEGIKTVERQWLFAVGLIFAFSIIQYLSRSWKCEKSLLHYNRGILRRNKQSFSLEKAACVEMSDSPFLRIFGAKKLSVRTADKNGKTSFSLIVSRDEIPGVVRSLNLSGLKRVHKTSFHVALLSSLLGTNASLGLLIGAPLVNRIGKYTGERLQTQVLLRWNETLNFFARFLPPLFAAAALLMIAGWLFGVIYSALRYSGCELLKNDEFIVFRGGVWKRTVRIFPKKNLQGFLVSETPLMMAGKFCRIYAVAGVCEKMPGELPMLLPLIKKNKISFPEECLKRLGRPEQYRVFLGPFYVYCFVTVLVGIINLLFPAYRAELFIIMVLSFMILVCLYSSGNLQLKTGGAGENTVVSVRRITRLTFFAAPSSIRETFLTQTYYQRKSGASKSGIAVGGAERTKLKCDVSE